MTDLEKAVELLTSSSSTCAVCKEDKTYISDKRGVAPLLGWLDSDIDLSGASAADKVVGNAAAYLYVLLNVKFVHAFIISEHALHTLQKYDISVTYDRLVKAILNRTKDGYCPMEQAVAGASSPIEALTLIRDKIRSLAVLPSKDNI